MVLPFTTSPRMFHERELFGPGDIDDLLKQVEEGPSEIVPMTDSFF